VDYAIIDWRCSTYVFFGVCASAELTLATMACIFINGISD
jgi:hypothetical protein